MRINIYTESFRLNVYLFFSVPPIKISHGEFSEFSLHRIEEVVDCAGGTRSEEEIYMEKPYPQCDGI